MAPFWLRLGHLGSILALSWLHLGASWSHVGSLLAPTWPSWRSLGPSWSYLGSNLAVLARPWLSLWRPEAPFGLLKPRKTIGKWRFFKIGTMSAHVDASLASWSHVGSILAPIWPSWHYLGTFLSKLRNLHRALNLEILKKPMS